MRLIDADEIRWADHYDSDGNLSKYKVAYSDEMPPTVDAVPVEWIRKYTEENRLYQSDDFDLYISDMIADWAERKE